MLTGTVCFWLRQYMYANGNIDGNPRRGIWYRGSTTERRNSTRPIAPIMHAVSWNWEVITPSARSLSNSISFSSIAAEKPQFPRPRLKNRNIPKTRLSHTRTFSNTGSPALNPPVLCSNRFHFPKLHLDQAIETTDRAKAVAQLFISSFGPTGVDSSLTLSSLCIKTEKFPLNPLYYFFISPSQEPAPPKIM